MSSPITVTRDGHIAEIVFRNPPNNHVTIDLFRALGDTLKILDSEPDCRAIVLASEGKIFCAGADLRHDDDGLGGASADPTREFYDQALRLFSGRKPIVAAVQGAAIGAGLGLAVAADFRVAALQARFAANFTRLGYHPGFGLTHTLPRLIGPQRANLMFMTSRRFKAEEVVGWGLVDQVSDAAALRSAALALAREIAENSPLGLIATRRTMRADLLEQVTAALIREHAEQAVLHQTADFAEGVSSVFERRAAHFIGR